MTFTPYSSSFPSSLSFLSSLSLAFPENSRVSLNSNNNAISTYPILHDFRLRLLLLGLLQGLLLLLRELDLLG